MSNEKSVKRIIRKAMCFAVIASSTCFFIGITQASDAKQHASHTTEEGSTIHLSHDLKKILNQEMNEIEQGMMEIIPAISAGNWETIVKIAKKIKKSFILKQKLTKKQMAELHHSLPAEFIEMDQNFHSTAGKLADAALEHDGELVNFYFYKLHSQCIDCHLKFSANRFPKLKKSQHNKADHNE